MITVEVKANGNLIKHIWVVEGENVYNYEYYKPGSAEVIAGIVRRIKGDKVTEVILRVMNDIQGKKEELKNERERI